MDCRAQAPCALDGNKRIKSDDVHAQAPACGICDNGTDGAKADNPQGLSPQFCPDKLILAFFHKFADFGSFAFAEDRDIAVKYYWGEARQPQPVKARYVKVHVETLGNCPSWHYGVGYAAWFFLDEVIVR